MCLLYEDMDKLLEFCVCGCVCVCVFCLTLVLSSVWALSPVLLQAAENMTKAISSFRVLNLKSFSCCMRLARCAHGVPGSDILGTGD